VISKDLPSLNAIRFFESAARHLSFTRAGEELFVTQGAVSKQIKLLEEQLGLALFTRKGPYLQLTRQGEKLYEVVNVALDSIASGVRSIRSQGDPTLTVTILPSFASNWLIPRLGRFEECCPEISLRLASSFTNVDFARQQDIDIGIRLGNGHWPGLFSAQITHDRMFPVCRPDVATRITKISDLENETLLVDAHPYDEWERWFQFLDLPYLAAKRSVFDDTGTQIQGAVEGRGISLVRQELVSGYLESGILVRLFDVEYFSDYHYFLVYPESRSGESRISSFQKWILEEAEQDRILQKV